MGFLFSACGKEETFRLRLPSEVEVKSPAIKTFNVDGVDKKAELQNAEGGKKEYLLLIYEADVVIELELEP